MKTKNYAVRLTIKMDGYKTKSLKGVVLAESPTVAKKLVVNYLLKMFEQYPLTEDSIVIRECVLHNDFIVNQNNQ